MIILVILRPLRRGGITRRINDYLTQKQISKVYNKQVRPEPFVGDLMLKAARTIQGRLSASKFVPKWEGPYVVSIL